MVVAIVIIVIILLILFWGIGVYNGLVKSKQKVGNSWSQIEVQLQRRFDLIPNLVETVKGYAKHESQVFEQVAKLRTQWANATAVSEKAQIGNELSSTLKTIMAVSENYPELKANSNFIQLQGQLQETENKIAMSRQFYNDAVTRYNTSQEIFPNNIIAGMFGFKQEKLFETQSEEAKNNVNVKFD